jgi:hypothetical protein
MLVILDEGDHVQCSLVRASEPSLPPPSLNPPEMICSSVIAAV